MKEWSLCVSLYLQAAHDDRPSSNFKGCKKGKKVGQRLLISLTDGCGSAADFVINFYNTPFLSFWFYLMSQYIRVDT